MCDAGGDCGDGQGAEGELTVGFLLLRWSWVIWWGYFFGKGMRSKGMAGGREGLELNHGLHGRHGCRIGSEGGGH